MTDETKGTKALKFRKVKGAPIWKAGGYLIENQGTDDRPRLLAMATGATPGELGTFTAADGEKRGAVMKRAQAACDEHQRVEAIDPAPIAPPQPVPEQAAKLSVASAEPKTQLIWEHDEETDVWTAAAPHGTYAVQEDNDADGRDRWFADLDSDEIGNGTTGEASREEAQAICQEHARLPAEERDETPVVAGSKGELGDWLLPVALTEPERAKMGTELGEIYVQIGEETVKITLAKAALKRAKDGAEAEIERLSAEALPVAEALKAGEEYRLVSCHRHKLEETRELYYTSETTGEELHRHAVAPGEQQGLFGNGLPPSPPADKPPEPEKTEVPPLEWVDEDEAGVWTSGHYRVACDAEGRSVLATHEEHGKIYQADDIALIELPLRLDEAKDLCAIDAQTRADLAAMNETPGDTAGPGTETDEDADQLPLPPVPVLEREPLKWMPTRLDGQPAYRASCPPGTTATDDAYMGEYRVERVPDGRPGKGLLQAIWAPTDGERLELRGTNTRVGDAKKQAEEHWQSRLRWPGDPDSKVQLDSSVLEQGRLNRRMRR